MHLFEAIAHPRSADLPRRVGTAASRVLGILQPDHPTPPARIAKLDFCSGFNVQFRDFQYKLANCFWTSPVLSRRSLTAVPNNLNRIGPAATLAYYCTKRNAHTKMERLDHVVPSTYDDGPASRSIFGSRTIRTTFTAMDIVYSSDIIGEPNRTKPNDLMKSENRTVAAEALTTTLLQIVRFSTAEVPHGSG